MKVLTWWVTLTHYSSKTFCSVMSAIPGLTPHPQNKEPESRYQLKLRCQFLFLLSLCLPFTHFSPNLIRLQTQISFRQPCRWWRYMLASTSNITAKWLPHELFIHSDLRQGGKIREERAWKCLNLYRIYKNDTHCRCFLWKCFTKEILQLTGAFIITSSP